MSAFFFYAIFPSTADHSFIISLILWHERERYTRGQSISDMLSGMRAVDTVPDPSLHSFHQDTQYKICSFVSFYVAYFVLCGLIEQEW